MKRTLSRETPSPTKDAEQLRAFRKAAREAGCEPDEKRFQDALRRVARAKPSEKDKKAQGGDGPQQ
jgi:hypothetical protein